MIDLRVLLSQIATRWKSIALITISFAGIAVVYAWKKPNIYEARLRFLLGNNAGGVSLSLTSAPSIPNEALASLAQSRDLMEQVIKVLKLQDHEGSPLAPEVLGANIVSYIEKKGPKDPLPILMVKVTHHDPPLAKSIAETWGTLYVSRVVDMVMAEIDRSYKFTKTEFDHVESRLAELGRAQLQFETNLPMGRMQSEHGVLLENYKVFLDKLISKQAQLAEAKARLESTSHALGEESAFFTLQRGISSEGVWMLLSDKPTEKKIDSIPKITLEEQYKNQIYERVRNELITVQTTVKVLEAEINDLQPRVAHLKTQIETLAVAMAEGTFKKEEFLRQGQVHRETFLLISKSLPAYQMAMGFPAGYLRLVEAPVLPSIPVGPRRFRIVAIAVVIGFAIGFLQSIWRAIKKSQGIDLIVRPLAAQITRKPAL